VASLLIKALRAASVGICLIVAASFLVFAVDRTSTASGHQQEEIGPTATSAAPTSTSAAPAASTVAPVEPSQGASGKGAPKKHRENSFHKGLDEVASELTSPVAGVGSNSEWLERGVRLLFALLVYGFGLGYLARALRVRT
jgi:hypothetical protein